MKIGQIAYEAYFKYSQGKSLISGASLPQWDKQDDIVRAAWEAAAEAVKSIQQENPFNFSVTRVATNAISGESTGRGVK